MIRLGIIGSTRGTNLLAIFDAINSDLLSAEVAVVLINKQDALILEKGKLAGAPSFFVDPAGLSRDEYDEKLSQIRKNFEREDYTFSFDYMDLYFSLDKKIII